MQRSFSVAYSYITIANMHMWPDFPKGVLYTHNFKTHFSSPSVSYINAPKGYVFTTAESEQSAFTQAFFSSLSGVHECSGSL